MLLALCCGLLLCCSSPPFFILQEPTFRDVVVLYRALDQRVAGEAAASAAQAAESVMTAAGEATAWAATRQRCIHCCRPALMHAMPFARFCDCYCSIRSVKHCMFVCVLLHVSNLWLSPAVLLACLAVCISVRQRWLSHHGRGLTGGGGTRSSRGALLNQQQQR